MLLKFGVHKGKSICQVDQKYLSYLLTQAWLKTDLRDAIGKVLQGTYVSPIALTNRLPDPSADRVPYHPDNLDRVPDATKTGAKSAILDAGRRVSLLPLPETAKSLVLEMLVLVAKDHC